MSPVPVNDQVESPSMLSSTRESRTFLFSHRNSAPSSYRACIGISGTICCAARDTPKQETLRNVVMLNRRDLLAHLLHLDLISMIGPSGLQVVTPRPLHPPMLTLCAIASGV